MDYLFGGFAAYAAEIAGQVKQLPTKNSDEFSFEKKKKLKIQP